MTQDYIYRPCLLLLSDLPLLITNFWGDGHSVYATGPVWAYSVNVIPPETLHLRHLRVAYWAQRAITCRKILSGFQCWLPQTFSIPIAVWSEELVRFPMLTTTDVQFYQSCLVWLLTGVQHCHCCLADNSCNNQMTYDCGWVKLCWCKVIYILWMSSF